MSAERHMKWREVEPGYVIPAGQPYRIEWPRRGGVHPDELLASERVCDHHTMTAFQGYGWFVDSSWDPLDLPTKPTWGIAVWEARLRQPRRVAVLGKWRKTSGGQFGCGSHTAPLTGVLDFIPLTDEQVQRIESAR